MATCRRAKTGDYLNPNSLEVLSDCKLEPSLAEVPVGTQVQFERLGHFTPDSGDHTAEMPVFNRSVTLRDSWAKKQIGRAISRLHTA